MAAGKTTVGRALSGQLGLELVDSDTQLLVATGMTAADLAVDRGRDDLHALEADLLLQALATTSRSVIAAAASVVDNASTRAALQADDLLVAWLAADTATLSGRIGPDDHRPRHDADMARYLVEQAPRRDAACAELADVIVDATAPIEAIVAQLVGAWSERSAGGRPVVAEPGTIAGVAFDPTTGPRDASVEPLAPDGVAWLLEASLAAFEAELLAMGDELAGWHPAPGEWCAKEVVGHVIEADRRGFAGRIGRILEAGDGAAIEEAGWDQRAVAAERGDCGRAVEELAAELRSVRERGLVLVRSLGSQDLSRRARHEVAGEVTVGELLQEWVFHDRNHIRQLVAHTQARVWPVMGNTRRFTDLDA